MVHLNGLSLEVASKGLHVVAVSIVTGMTTVGLRHFVQRNGLTFQVLHGSNGHVSLAFHTTAVPETFDIAADGTMRKNRIGTSDWNRSQIARSPRNCCLRRTVGDRGALKCSCTSDAEVAAISCSEARLSTRRSAVLLAPP